MTDSPALFDSEYQPLLAHSRPPGVVLAAAVVTWLAATGTALFTLLLTVSFLWLAAPVFDSFESGSDNPRWFVLAFGVVVVVLSVLADVVAIFVMRGSRWAQLVLIALSLVAALAGIMASYYIAPLLVTASAVAVTVLLVLPDARAWFALPERTTAQATSG